MTSKESLFAILNAVGGLMFLAVLVTVCLAIAAAPVAVFIWRSSFWACLRKSFGLLPAVLFSSCSPTPGEGLSTKEETS